MARCDKTRSACGAALRTVAGTARVAEHGESDAPADRRTSIRLPTWVPSSSPRRVSVMGVNGWYSAKLTQAGAHRRGGHEAAAEEGQEDERRRQVALAPSGAFGEAGPWPWRARSWP